MVESSLPIEGLMDSGGPSWAPSPKLRRWLLIGTWAVIASIILSALSLSIDLSRKEDPKGFSVTDLLDLSVIIPQVLILTAFLHLAREAGSAGLRRSAIGVFVSGWLMAALVYSGAEEVEKWEILAIVGVVIGVIAMLIAIARSTSGFPPSESVEPPPVEPAGGAPEEKAPEAKKSGWGCGAFLGILIAAKLLSRLGRGMIKGIDFDWRFVSFIGFAVLFVGLMIFLVWFGVSKIRLRRKLGSAALASGIADLIAIALWVGVSAYAAVLLVKAVNEDREPDFNDPALRIPFTAISAYDLLWQSLIAVLFVSVRGKEREEAL